MQIISQKDGGLFPSPHEIKVTCSCPDYATMCKHVSGVLYSIGAKLDSQPELLFVLRQADHFELLASANTELALNQSPTQETLDTSQLSALFGIDIDETVAANSSIPSEKPKKQRKKSTTLSTAKRLRSKLKR
jgi:uncharacterized Zn finger protein